ncbi:MAG: undecaprenyldiphospho-muramoylpentapeptide beta-N-acetylglucosaminyltransferase [Oscillospiraceae bacterium]|nr:undecaprenyldiphospho-muramoylpentapeptide beta-N-acetylglucosaminyltransferase [Oscillospiraceae bacterium]
MKILFACGGSGGHIYPALGIADTIKKQHKHAEILFAGNPDGMEARLVPEAGYAFAPIRVQGFPRRLSLENIKRNIRAAALLLKSGAAARKIVSGFCPDVVVGTGGYVSGPILRAAAKLGFKTVTHESNAFPGVTTKLLARYVDKVLLSVEEAKQHLPQNREYIVTGTPIRQEILFIDRAQARKKLGVGSRLCLLSIGGSLGAAPVNEAVAGVMGHFQGRGVLHHIHATGERGWASFQSLLEKNGVAPGDAHMDIREYIYDMQDCLVAADLAITRCGAVTLAELQCTGKPSILIPSPYLAENHQYHNAMVLANKNAAIVIEEKDLSAEKLCRLIEELANDPDELANLGKNAASLAVIDANRRICDEIYDLIGK